jgi:uncharacterized membrane protein YfcA
MIPELPLLLAVGFFAGVCNAVVGGGTLFTFPVLIAAGIPPVLANTTTTVALLPGTMTSAFAYLPQLHPLRQRLTVRIVTASTGGLLGAALLLWSGNTVFFYVVPWLLGVATILFTLSRWIVKRARSASQRASHWRLLAMEFASAIYGGYFGAAIGILLIASMAIAGQEDMQSVNAQRNFLVVFINGIAAVLFILRGTVNWPVAFILMGGAILGGYCGARLARFLPNLWMRRVVTAAGAFFSLYYFVKAYG